MEYISHPLSFSLCVCLCLKWVSCRQHIYGSCFCFHSASLCHLVLAFNLHLNINWYICSYCHFLSVWGWFCRFSFFFSFLVFLDYISPCNICCKAGLVVLNSLNFCLSEKLFISPSILNEIFARYKNLGCRFFPFSTLNIFCLSLLDWRVSAERPAVN